MTVKEIRHLCIDMKHAEKAMEHIFDNGINDSEDYEALHCCVETLEKARYTIDSLLDTVNVI